MGWADMYTEVRDKPANAWTDTEIGVLSRAMSAMHKAEGKIIERRLARELADSGVLPKRTRQGIYIRIRAALHSGEANGWFSTTAIGHGVI